MPAAALKASNTTDLMKKEEGNDSLDTFIRQAIGKEPFLSFSRAGDSSVQWIQLLNALDQQDTPGWPLLTPLKAQMRKCDKCSREFYSSINYRRHIRVHHRLKKLGKDSAKNRDLLRIFWDKLPEDEAKELLSFDDVSLEEVPGSSIIKSLMELVRRPGFSSLPQYCLKAGSALLDIIQPKASRFSVSSEELFSILDDASEKTFLCGSAVSMQKYIFDGEAGKIGVETKNLIACTGFLLEQKLVKAWLADKDAEALRCQKLLVEEEEAAQRRQAELLERKRLKKLRQKEQKAKDQRQATDVTDLEERINDSLEAVPLADLSCPLTTSDSDHRSSTLEPLQLPSTDEDVDLEIQTGSGSGYSDSGTNNNSERQMVRRNNQRESVVQWHLSPKSQWNQRQNGRRDFKSVPVMNGARKWSQKAKTDSNGNILRIRQQTISQQDENKKHELLIGSISVTLAIEDHLLEHPMQKKTDFQKQNRPNSAHYSTNRPITKHWRLVSRNGIKETPVVDQIPSNENGSSPSYVDHDYIGTESNFSGVQNSVLGGTQFSSQAAKAFLAERWKDAIATEHVRLVLSPDDRSAECEKVVLSELSDAGVLESSTAGFHKTKFKSKTVKGFKLKYIPKQRATT